MKRSTLSPWLQLAPQSTDGNGPAASAPAKPAAAAPAPTTIPAKGKAASGPPKAEGLSTADLIAEIEKNPAAFETEPAPTGGTADGVAEDGDEDEGAPGAETAEVKAAREAKEKKEAEIAAKAREDARPTPELNADQKAWMELRAAARTPEEAAEVDKEAPVFTDEEWALVEKEFSDAARGDARPTTELQTQLTAAQAEAAQVKSDLEAQSKRLKEVETELARAQAQPVAIAPMNPLMTADAGQLDQAEAAAQQMKEWALKNFEGSPAIPATATTPEQPAYTAEQVRAAYARADKQLTQVIPAARQYLADHVAHNVSAKQVYPELFNPQSEEHVNTQSILRRLPGLRAALPNISTIFGDAILGEKLRLLIVNEKPTAEALALAAALVKADPTLAKFMPALTGKPAARPIGRLPAKPLVALARPSASGRSLSPRPAANGKAKGTPDSNKFVTLRTENGGDELAALTETLRNVNVE